MMKGPHGSHNVRISLNLARKRRSSHNGFYEVLTDPIIERVVGQELFQLVKQLPLW